MAEKTKKAESDYSEQDRGELERVAARFQKPDKKKAKKEDK